jgi:hypothetical protein
MTEHSNRLPILASEARSAHKMCRDATEVAAAMALKAGGKLVEAKSLCRHGEWTPWLKTTGISERSAQRYMLLFRSGLKTAIVADLGFRRGGAVRQSRHEAPTGK